PAAPRPPGDPRARRLLPPPRAAHRFPRGSRSDRTTGRKGDRAMRARGLSAAGRTAGLLLTLAASARARAQTLPAPPPSPAPAAAAGESRKVAPYGILYFNGFGNSA